MSVPFRCPVCKNWKTWKKIDTQKKGFSVGKAVAGGVILGPLGLVAGGLGKKMETWRCGECGFMHEYKA